MGGELDDGYPSHHHFANLEQEQTKSCRTAHSQLVVWFHNIMLEVRVLGSPMSSDLEINNSNNVVLRVREGRRIVLYQLA